MTVPQQLNHYRVISPLAKGGMGDVFVAEDMRLHRKVALKVLSGLTATAPNLELAFWLPRDGAVEIMRMAPHGKPHPIARIEENLFNLKWSRDGKQIVMARGQTTSDVILITTK